MPSYLESLTDTAGRHPIAVLALAFLPLLAWRFLRFTLCPLIRQTKYPPEYPYWIPVVGHLRSFFTNSNRLISDAKSYFHNTGDTFSLTIAGQTWYIVTNPEQVLSVYKLESSSLSYDMFVVNVMRMVGVSEEGVRKAYQAKHSDGDSSEKKMHKNLVKLSKDYHSGQLLSGTRLEQLTQTTIKTMMKKLNSESIYNSQRWYTNSLGSDSVSVSLYQWASDISIGVLCHAFFGPMLQENRPEITRAFMEFENYSWQALYQYPSFLCGNMNKAKEKVRGAIEEYFALPDEERLDRSWLVAQLEGEMKQLDMTSQDISALFFQLYWGINANPRKALFWTLSYLLFDSELMESIHHETMPAIKGNDIDMSYLLETQKCPRLLSLWDEAIRITAYAASVRFLTRDIELGGKTLRKGGWIMIPQRQLHYNTDAFGENASTFVAERFLSNPELRKHPSLRPFGGGATLCPGRDYTKQITLAFIAAALNKLEITLDPPAQQFPLGEEGKPSPGIIGIKDGHDLTVRLRPRTTKEHVM